VYAVALVSGVVALLPSLVKDLFLLRISHNVKRMWLDAHNVLGISSLPFHIVMALTAAVFGLHEWIFEAQAKVIYPPGKDPYAAALADASPRQAGQAMRELPPSELLARLRQAAPAFEPKALNYSIGPDGRKKPEVWVAGADDRYFLRDGHVGYAIVDLFSGRVTGTTYLPGHQTAMAATLSSFFGLHFGNYGGLPVRILYVVLGVLGALLFYSGNLLWIESRRKRRQIEQPRVHRFLARLTVGVCLGCCAALSAAFISSLLLQSAAGEWRTYYAIFLGSVLWAQLRPPARAAIELALLAGVLSLAVPVTNAIVTGDHLLHAALTGQWQVFGVDAVAIALGLGFLCIAQVTWRRARGGDPHSVWSLGPPAGTARPAG